MVTWRYSVPHIKHNITATVLRLYISRWLQVAALRERLSVSIAYKGKIRTISHLFFLNYILSKIIRKVFDIRWQKKYDEGLMNFKLYTKLMVICQEFSRQFDASIEGTFISAILLHFRIPAGARTASCFWAIDGWTAGWPSERSPNRVSTSHAQR